MFVYGRDESKLSRGAPRVVETVEQPEDGFGVRSDLEPPFLHLFPQLLHVGDHRRVDLLVAEQDLALELAGLLLLCAEELPEAFAAAEHGRNVLSQSNPHELRAKCKNSGLEPDQIWRVDVAGDAAEVDHQGGGGDDL